MYVRLFCRGCSLEAVYWIELRSELNLSHVGLLTVSHAFYHSSICHLYRSLNPCRNLILSVLSTLWTQAMHPIASRGGSFLSVKRQWGQLARWEEKAGVTQRTCEGFLLDIFTFFVWKSFYFCSEQPGRIFRSQEHQNIIAAIMKLFYSLNRSRPLIGQCGW